MATGLLLNTLTQHIHTEGVASIGHDTRKRDDTEAPNCESAIWVGYDQHRESDRATERVRLRCCRSIIVRLRLAG